MRFLISRYSLAATILTHRRVPNVLRKLYTVEHARVGSDTGYLYNVIIPTVKPITR